VDGTLIEAWASQKSFRAKDGGDNEGDGADFRGPEPSLSSHRKRCRASDRRSHANGGAAGMSEQTFHLGYCAICKSDDQKVVVPLHGEQGGPLVCHVCYGKWQAEHGRRRKAGRVVIRAIQAYEKAGGKWTDVDKLKMSALDGFGEAPWNMLDPLGYMADAVNTIGEQTDLTSELLDAAIRLTHPDCHPPERLELAKSVTQELLALKPFAFPKPDPKPPWPEGVPPPPNGSLKEHSEYFKEPLREALAYPCNECKSTVPYFYCTPCRAEWDKRRKVERDAACATQREQYARRKRLRDAMHPRHCAICQAKLSGKRKDAKFCSNTCRQRAARKAALIAVAGILREGRAI
jgi:hypothetical protein